MPAQHTSVLRIPTAAMVELVDTRDLKSLDPKRSCGFESRSRHHYHGMMIMRFLHNYILPLLLLQALLLSVSSCGSGDYDVNIDGHLLHMNQGKFLNAAMGGHTVLLKSRYGSFKITPVTEDDTLMNKSDLTERVCAALREVKMIEDGVLKPKTLDELIDEL